ncbi:hypothetical protein H0E87_001501, partial [Populus deltoides]
AQIVTGGIAQMSFILGIGLAVVVDPGSALWTDLLLYPPISLLLVHNPSTLAFVFDGVNFGASDFAYSSYSMVLVATASIAAIFVLS